jgi:hypothetical protein
VSDTTDDLTGKEAAQQVVKLRQTLAVFDRNGDELIVNIDHPCSPTVALGYSPVDQRWKWRAGMDELLRLLHNFVASALSLVDHTRIVYRKLYRPQGLIADYQDRVDVSFRTDPVTQFVLGLRQMAQHYRMPSVGDEKKFVSVGPNGLSEVSISLKLNVASLREFSSWNSVALKFLDDAGGQVDLRDVVTRYRGNVKLFYDWFEAEQRRLHGLGPDLLQHFSRHGRSPLARPEVTEAARRVGELEARDPATLAYDDLYAAFDPVLTAFDIRLLVLCEHNPEVWIETALALVARHFAKTDEIAASARRVVAPRDTSQQTGSGG